jgi:hypothetical protein
LVTATLVIPGSVGWSGTRARKSSTDCLKLSTASDTGWQQIEEPTALHTQRTFLCSHGSCRGCPDICMGFSQSGPAYVIVTELETISSDPLFKFESILEISCKMMIFR